jgi:hypothetical protein
MYSIRYCLNFSVHFVFMRVVVIIVAVYFQGYSLCITTEVFIFTDMRTSSISFFLIHSGITEAEVWDLLVMLYQT